MSLRAASSRRGSSPFFAPRSKHCKRAGVRSTRSSLAARTGAKARRATPHSHTSHTAPAAAARAASSASTTDGRARRRRPGPPQGVGRPLDRLLRGPRSGTKGLVGSRIKPKTRRAARLARRVAMAHATTSRRRVARRRVLRDLLFRVGPRGGRSSRLRVGTSRRRGPSRRRGGAVFLGMAPV